MKTPANPYAPPPDVARTFDDIQRDMDRQQWIGRSSTMELPSKSPDNGERKDTPPEFP